MGHNADHSNTVATATRRSVPEFSDADGCLSKAFHTGPYIQTVTSFDTGHYLYVNDNFVKAAGYAREEVIGKTSSEIGLLANKRDRRWLTEVLRQHGRLNNRKLLFRLRSGDVRVGLFDAEVIKVDGEDCILSTVRNIATEDHHQQKSYALDLVHDAVVALDPQGHITYFNRAAAQFYGWTPLQVTGGIARTILFANNKEVFDAAWHTLQETGEWSGEITQLTKNGERVLESRWSAIREKHSSRITSILIVSTDTSSLNETIAGLAHEIRNPLASIKGVADTFLQRSQLTKQEREWIEAIRREVIKIDEHMRELLDVSQPRVFHIKQCCLSELVNGVVLLARNHIKAIKERDGRQISIKFIDETKEPIVMHLDPPRIEDAVLNLVLNAIDSIDKNGRVTVCLRRAAKRVSVNSNGEVLIEVTDTGCGIPLEIRQRIFEPRFTTKREGTGLGLVAVRRTTAAYQGRITFTTKIGRGSKFVLALPYDSTESTENPG
ncbi:MAG TPA: ATP-binding protein [Pyrinomonadaceae bacterium]